MLVTNHVLQGALLGAAVRHPVPALLLGVVSHFVADALPHWGGTGAGVRDAAFLRVAVPDGVAGLVAMGIVSRAAPERVRAAVVAGMVGAALPDLDKPWALVTGGVLWPPAVTRFHGRIQREAPHRLPLEVALVGAAVLLLLAGSRVAPGSRVSASG